MNIFMRYPMGKAKALTFSYDDGTVQDIRLIELFNKYGMKATFNLNGMQFIDQNRLTNTVKWLTREQAVSLYKDCGHEVAIHGMFHDHIQANPVSMEMYNALAEREILEGLFGGIVRGMAYPYGAYKDSMAKALLSAGIVYGRRVESSHNFNIPVDDDPMWWMQWRPTCHHADPKVFELAEKFVEAKFDCFPELFYIWGHSVELDHNNGWEHMERLCEYLSGKTDIWYATNIEIYDYFKAYHRLQFSIEGSRVYNPNAITVWIAANGKTYEVAPKQTVEIE